MITADLFFWRTVFSFFGLLLSTTSEECQGVKKDQWLTRTQRFFQEGTKNEPPQNSAMLKSWNRCEDFPDFFCGIPKGTTTKWFRVSFCILLGTTSKEKGKRKKGKKGKLLKLLKPRLSLVSVAARRTCRRGTAVSWPSSGASVASSMA